MAVWKASWPQYGFAILGAFQSVQLPTHHKTKLTPQKL